MGGPCTPALAVTEPAEKAVFCVDGVGWKVRMENWGLVQETCGGPIDPLLGYAVYRAPVVGGVVGAYVLVDQQTPWMTLCPWVSGSPPVTTYVPCITDQPPGAGDYVYRICALLTSGATVCSALIPVTIQPMVTSWAATGMTQVQGAPLDALELTRFRGHGPLVGTGGSHVTIPSEVSHRAQAATG